MKFVLEKLGSIMSLPMVVLLIIFFFLPWVNIKCQDTKIATMTGRQLTSGDVEPVGIFKEMSEKAEKQKHQAGGGTEAEGPEDKDKLSSRQWIYAGLAIPLLGFIVAFAHLADWLNGRSAGIALLAIMALGVSLLVAVSQVDLVADVPMETKDNRADATEGAATQPQINLFEDMDMRAMMSSGLESGWILSLVFYLLLGLCGVVNLVLPLVGGRTVAGGMSGASPPPGSPPPATGW
jgi:hypothetical protein